MEPNQLEESKSGSSEETNKSDQPNSDEMCGAGRSYECIFCKRGFTTAQALGGHMNIHRKDRARPKPSGSLSPIISSKIEEGYGSFRAYPPIQSYPSFNPTHHEVHLNYQSFYPSASTWGFRPSHAQNSEDLCARNFQHPTSQLEEYRGRSNTLSLQIGIGSSDIDDERKGEENDDGLDLELRLGHLDQ